ncbi:hypothetical protein BGZ49_002083 [Haplosporangium sp. Z 27]|nr:hypothetical protein BGZ49_002083 [Haplosporangium sp. Z 27]
MTTSIYPPAQPFALKRHTTTIFIIILSSLSLIIPSVHAELSCVSPFGSHNVGDTVTLEWTDNGQYPRVGDVYSTALTVFCSSNSVQLAQVTSVSNGEAMVIPTNILQNCPGNQIYVEYSGQQYDALHLLHVATYSINCRDIVITIPTTTITGSITSTPTAPVIGTGTPASGTAIIVIPTIITTDIVSTVIVTATAPGNTHSANSTASSMGTSSTTSPLHDQPGPNTVTSETKNNIPAAALGTIGGLVVVAFIIFCMMRARKKKLEKNQRVIGWRGRGRKTSSWDQGGYNPDESTLDFFPLQHHSDMRDYRGPSSQPSSMHRSITNIPKRPEPGFRGEDMYRNAVPVGAIAASYLYGQSHVNGVVPGPRYVDEYGYEQDYNPYVMPTSQSMDHEYYNRMLHFNSAEIPPLPTTFNDNDLKSIPPTEAEISLMRHPQVILPEMGHQAWAVEKAEA